MTNAGLSSYTLETSEVTLARFHLRIDPDGSGILLANASSVCRLSPTGVIIADALLSKMDDNAIRAMFTAAPRAEVERDIRHVREAITLMSSADRSVVFNLGDPGVSPDEQELGAPFRADIPVDGRADEELLLKVVDQLWKIGIPHVVFRHSPARRDRKVGVTPSAKPELLVRLVERAEDLGMIAGVQARGTELVDNNLIGGLAQAGVDHLNIFYASTIPPEHDHILGDGDHQLAVAAFEHAAKAEVDTVAVAPLLPSNCSSLDKLLAAVRMLRSRALVVYAVASVEETGAWSANALPQLAAQIEELADIGNVRVLWEPPLGVGGDVPLRDQVRAGTRPGDVGVLVTASGDVIPSRGPATVAGNILENSWADIWDHDAFRRFRERVASPTRCDTCPGLAACAADCPKEPQGWALP